jgi:hypothetical protein
MPPWLATMTHVSPSTQFLSFAQALLDRGAGLDVVWPQFAIVAVIGGLFFGLAILRFRVGHRASSVERKREIAPITIAPASPRRASATTTRELWNPPSEPSRHVALPVI